MKSVEGRRRMQVIEASGGTSAEHEGPGVRISLLLVEWGVGSP